MSDNYRCHHRLANEPLRRLFEAAPKPSKENRLQLGSELSSTSQFHFYL